MTTEPFLLNPTIDYVFKRMVCHPGQKRVLIALLTCILEPASPIEDVEILDREMGPDEINEKGVVFDVLVRMADGTWVNIEMQVGKTPSFRSRVQYYWGRTYAGQAKRGGKFKDLKPVVVIVLTNYVETEVRRVHSAEIAMERDEGNRLNKDFEIHFVELPKIADAVALEKAHPVLRLWAKFFGARTDEDRVEVAMQDENIAEALKVLRELSADLAVRKAAEDREAEHRLLMMELEKEGREKMEQGLAIGRVEGEAKGLVGSILRVLSTRGIEASPHARQRVEACRDIETLDRWFTRALTMNVGDPLFAE